MRRAVLATIGTQAASASCVKRAVGVARQTAGTLDRHRQLDSGPIRARTSTRS
jgi:hypothetical protein